MRFMKSVFCLAVAGVVFGASLVNSVAADEAKGKKKGGGKSPAPTQRFVAEMDLTAEQKDQVAEIDREFADRFKELNKARTDILTAEQQAAEKSANKANRTSGKKGPDAKKAVDEALKLTDEQKAKMKDVQKQQTELNGKIVAALRKVLTPEQQEKLPKIAGEKGKGKGKGKKATDSGPDAQGSKGAQKVK